MSKLRLTVACGDYDIVRPLKEGLVEADGLDLIFLSDMGPRERHWRMGRKHEFDVCEENVGAYFMIRDQGEPLTAMPVFLHRRFRHGFVFVNTNAGIKSPRDLNGKSSGAPIFNRRPASGSEAFWKTPMVLTIVRSLGSSTVAKISHLHRRRVCASK